MSKDVFWVFLERGGITFLQFISTIILGRILAVEDFGIYGVMLVFIVVSEMLIDSGLGGAIIQKKEVSQTDINTLFITNLAVSLVLYALVFGIAPFIERLYDIMNLTLYLRVSSLVIIFFALSIVQNSLLIRNLRFRRSMLINLISTSLSILIAIILAQKGAGVWALITQNLSNAFLFSLILWITSPIKITNNISKESFLSLWNFGSNLLVANVLSTIANNIVSNVIPKIGTINQSGLYLQASKLSNVPNKILTSSIDKSTFPILSKVDQKERLGKARKINRYFIVLFTPIFPILSLFAYPIIVLLLGEKWEEAANYFEILAWSGWALMVQALYRNIVKSDGKTRLIMNLEIAKTFITLTVIIISLFWGVMFLIWGILISYYICAALWAIVMKYKMGYKIKYQFQDFFPSFFICMLFYIFAKMLNYSIGVGSLFLIPFVYIFCLLVFAFVGNTEVVYIINSACKWLFPQIKSNKD